MLLTLNAMCSRKCATPLVSSVSNLLPASIHSPTVHVLPPWFSEATRIPLGRTVTLVSGTLYSDYQNNPKLTTIQFALSPRVLTCWYDNAKLLAGAMIALDASKP